MNEQILSDIEQMSMPLTSKELEEIIKSIPQPKRTFSVSILSLEEWINVENNACGENSLELNPEFQRGHVWTTQQQVKFLENLMRGLIDNSGLTIRFNNPSWISPQEKDSDLKIKTVCIDGLQRITAVRKFINNEIAPFGLLFTQFPRSFLRPLCLTMCIYELQYMKDVLQLYLDINSGGTPHSKKSLEKVKLMLKEVKGG